MAASDDTATPSAAAIFAASTTKADVNPVDCVHRRRLRTPYAFSPPRRAGEKPHAGTLQRIEHSLFGHASALTAFPRATEGRSIPKVQPRPMGLTIWLVDLRRSGRETFWNGRAA